MVRKFKFLIIFSLLLFSYPMASKAPIDMPAYFWKFQCRLNFAHTKLVAKYFSEKGMINNLFHRRWNYSYSTFTSI